jgi:hypothetical protein
MKMITIKEGLLEAIAHLSRLFKLTGFSVATLASDFIEASQRLKLKFPDHSQISKLLALKTTGVIL